MLETIPVDRLDEALAAELLRLWERSVRATHTFLDEPTIRDLRPEVRRGLEAVRLTLARENGVILGFSGTLGDMLEMLFVDAAAQGRGVGSRLLRQAVDQGVTRLDVNEQNPRALAFYTRRGCVPSGRSETDSQGRPFPLIHLRVVPPDQG